MSTRNILLASFIETDRLEWFYGFMEGRHYIKRKGIFKYRQIAEPDLNIMTFRFSIDTDDRVNFNALFPNALLIHKKGDALYTINGLNKLIESDNSEMAGNLVYSDVIIDWSEYQNRMIMVDGDNLVINEIERIF